MEPRSTQVRTALGHAPHLHLDLLQLSTEGFHLSLQVLNLDVPGVRGRGAQVHSWKVTDCPTQTGSGSSPGAPQDFHCSGVPTYDLSSQRLYLLPQVGPGDSPVILHGAIGRSKSLIKEVSHHLP